MMQEAGGKGGVGVDKGEMARGRGSLAGVLDLYAGGRPITGGVTTCNRKFCSLLQT